MISVSHVQHSSPAVGYHSLPRCGLPAMQTTAVGSLDRPAAQTRSFSAPTSDTPFADICARLNDKVTTFLQSEHSSRLLKDVQRQTEISLQVLSEAVERYGIEKVALSYNGGKDCLVLLILWLVALHRHYRSSSHDTPATSDNRSACHRAQFPDSVESVYVQAPNSFREVDDFVRETSHQYRLHLYTLTKPMKGAFAEYLQQRPKIELIIVGTRRTDPHGAELTHFAPTDGDWPRFMRCHPVIDWHYREIWEFIRHLEIPYCSLYDAGYTSLGGIEDTHPNPELKIQNAEGEDNKQAKYRPAYELMEDDQERLGRNRG